MFIYHASLKLKFYNSQLYCNEETTGESHGTNKKKAKKEVIGYEFILKNVLPLRYFFFAL